MNRGRVSRKYRNYRRGASNVVDMCLRCFHFGHHRITCRKEPIVTCGNCFRAYYFSTECPCNHNDTDGMTLRLVGGEPFPRPCIDVMIGNNNYEALINQSKSRTTINSEVFNYINFLKEQSNLPAVSSNEIIHFNIKRRQKEVMVEIETDKHQTNPIIIGMEFLTKTGFELRIDKVSVNQCSPVLESPTTINFLYNLEQGKMLRSWLETKKLPMYNKYEKGNQALLQEEARVIIDNEYHNNPQVPEHVLEDPVSQQVDSDADVLDLHTDTDDLDHF
ncbi:hypothetical protein ACFFRR_001111 [Megaselia abdita]